MKTIMLMLLCVLPLAGHADLMVNEGETFTWSFDSSDFAYDRDWSSPPDFQYTGWNLSLDLVFDVQSFKYITPIFKIATFEDNINEGSFSEATYTNTIAVAAVYDSLNIKWEDRQGIIQIEAIQGPFIIKDIEASTITNNELHTAAIPEPNSVALLLLGGGAFYLRRKKRFPTSGWSLS